MYTSVVSLVEGVMYTRVVSLVESAHVYMCCIVSRECSCIHLLYR